MLRKSLFIIIMIIFVSLEQIKASDDWLDFEVGAGVGLNGWPGSGYGYEAFLEYRFNKYSLYIIGNMTKNMEMRGSNGKVTSNSQMVGMQIKFYIFIFGYHHVSKYETTSNVIEEATNATSFGFIYSKKEWEGGLLFYEYNDKARNGENSYSGGVFIRKKFFF